MNNMDKDINENIANSSNLKPSNKGENEENTTLNKVKENENSAMFIIGVLSGIGCGYVFSPLCSNIMHNDMEAKIQYLEKDKEYLNSKIEKLEDDIVNRDKEIKYLSEKIAKSK